MITQPQQLDRFDPNFNDIDPESGRPFSSGHPDGVWILCIVLLVGSLIGTGLSIMDIQTSIKNSIVPIVGITYLLTVVIGYIPPIFMLFKRKAFAVKWFLGLLVWTTYLATVVFLADVLSPEAFEKELAITTIRLTAVAYIAYYVYGLKRDNLLF
jgi:phosphoglycerol transferase MdoB-like AlkP superfamily enzyme